jgi:chain length determinant protein tyrosine kinase EpsG
MKKIEAQVKDVPLTGRDRSRAFGSILVEHGRLSPSDAEEIERYAGANGLRFGDAAVQLKLLNNDDIAFALAHQFNYPILQRGGDTGVADDVIAAYNPQNALVEPLRAIRTQISHRWLDDSNRKAVSILSPCRGEGRSWLAANLATLFAQIGERTLLIDADMRHPSQHLLFNISNSLGMSALLTGRAGKEAAVRVHPQLRLFVLPAGALPPNPQELLARPVFDVVLERFIEQFDVILIDTPAATESADAHMLARRSGAAIMLARRNHTPHSKMVSAIRDMSHTGVNVIGSVMNEY